MSPECPSDDSMRRLDDEDHDPDRLAELDAHIAACEACQGRLGRLMWEISGATGDLEPGAHPKGVLPEIRGFEIREEIGRGGMGVVYLARQPDADRLVALKILPGGADSDQAVLKARRRWLREARATARGNHPQIVQLHDCKEEDGRFFLVMEYVPGGSLKRRMVDRPTIRDAARLIEIIARAVGHLHALDQLHLDLKPSNILLDGPTEGGWRDVVPKVADFGLSLTLEALADPDLSQQAPRGTPAYMAPEQAAGDVKALSPATDVWALGVILYELLAGRNPFEAETHLATLDRVRLHTPASVRTLNPNISRDLETIAMKCLEKAPGRRYATASSLADDLRRWLNGLSIQARPVSTIERAWRTLRRPVPSGYLASAGMILVALIAAILALLPHEALSPGAGIPHSDPKDAEATARFVTSMEESLLSELSSRGPGLSEDLGRRLQALRDKVASMRATGRCDSGILDRLAGIDDHAAGLRQGSGRFEEARALNRECLDLLRECRGCEPESHSFGIRIVGALLRASDIERDDSCPDRALDRLAQVLVEARTLPASSQFPGRFAVEISDRCGVIRDRFLATGDAMIVGRMRDLLAELSDLLEGVPKERPDCILFTACLLADQGEWGKARAMMDTIPPWTGPESPTAMWYEESVQIGLAKWIHHEIRSLELLATSHRVEWRDIDRQAARITEEWDRLCRSMQATDAMVRVGLGAMLHELALQATGRRHAGQLDAAENAADLFAAIGWRLVRDHPESAQAHWFLSEAYTQYHKNAWSRQAPRDELIQTLDGAAKELFQALSLDPSDAVIRTSLQDKQIRLAALIKG